VCCTRAHSIAAPGLGMCLMLKASPLCAWPDTSGLPSALCNLLLPLLQRHLLSWAAARHSTSTTSLATEILSKFPTAHRAWRLATGGLKCTPAQLFAARGLSNPAPSSRSRPRGGVHMTAAGDAAAERTAPAGGVQLRKRNHETASRLHRLIAGQSG
jgi:hypothetical protein